MAKNDEHYTASTVGRIPGDVEGQEYVRPVSHSDVPEGTVAELEHWVGDSKARAAAALEVEEAKGEDARTTLLEHLHRIASSEA